MIKTIHDRVLPKLLLMVILPIAQIGYADNGQTFTTALMQDSPEAVVEEARQALATYLYNLGGALGYDLKKAVTSPTNSFLLTPPAILQSVAVTALSTLFGAIPVNTSTRDPSLLNFVPSNNATYTAFNALANNTFASYNSPGSITPAGANATPTPVTVSPLIDQKTYQSDPVSQFILNFLGTPNYTYCMDSTGKNWLDKNNQTLGNCSYLYKNKVLSNIVGSLPPTPFLNPSTQSALLNELNGNALLAPLLYTTVPSNSTPPPTSGKPGLTATSQVQQATNFIRYASGAVIAPESPSQENYNKLLMAINSASNDRTTKESARAVLDKYLLSMRVYAAKSSVAVGNMYYILSKRIPQVQSQTDTSVNGTSQALSELSMATRRMYDPAALATGKPQWLTQIDTASPATVQKEMAILLAEINYQLYLNRQQEERLLLTNSLLLIENLKQDLPDIPAADSLSSNEESGSAPSVDGQDSGGDE